MNDEIEKLGRDLGARLFALQAGLLAVMSAHPQPQVLRQKLDAFEQGALASMLNLTWTDQQIAAYRRTVDQLREQIPR